MKLINAILSTSILSVWASDSIEPKGIVGGYEVYPPYKYNWMVSLQYANVHECGGSLYTYNSIISAAHCNFGLDRSWWASLHRHYIENPQADKAIFYPILYRTDHPKYNQHTKAYDVSVWKIDTPYSKNVYIDLDSNNLSVREGLQLKVIGWGHLYSGGLVANTLMEVQVPIYNLSQCKKSYKELDIKSQFCAGYKVGNKDACQADSGGPIFINNHHYITLVGVVSWGQGCASPNYPGVYTRIYEVKDFIQATVKTFH